MLCRLLFGTLLLSTLPAEAQFSVFVRKLLVGDTAAPPNYDTAYISTFRQKLTLSGVISYRLASVDLADSLGHEVTYSTNNATQYGLALNYRWLSVEATFSIPSLDPADPTYGATTSKGFGLSYTGRRLWARGFWNTSQGFYPETPATVSSTWKPGDDYPSRPDLVQETWMASVNYALSKKRRFSQVAALTQMERQIRSAGTWVAGGSFWHTRIDADSTLVPTEGAVAFLPDARIVYARRMLIGATIGYTHSFVLWHKGFIHIALLTGAAASDQERRLQGETTMSTIKGASSLTEFKMGAGYNGDRWYTGLTVSSYVNVDSDEESALLGSTYVAVRFALGYRFGRPNIKGMDKYGL